MTRRIYFDNAATSFPKPAAVHEAMLCYATQVGGTAGRGAYSEAREGGRIIRECRTRICELINGESADHVVFTLNTTDALNLAINGVVSQRRLDRPGERVHVVTTEMDHNSILRPLAALAETGVEWTCVPCDPRTGRVSAAAVASAIRPGTALVAVLHASNVTGTIQPVAEIGSACRAAGVPLLVDGAQSLGHISVDVRAMGIDLLAFPGHKGLLGPLGTGGLYLRPGMERLVRPVRTGGTGSRSELDVQPPELPDRYEPGSQNAIGIAGLLAGVEWILGRGDEHWEHERVLTAAMLERADGLERSGLRLLGPREVGERVGVFSFVHEGLSPAEAAGILESEFGILARAGLQCAPRAHGAMGTRPGGGTLRLSIGPFHTVEDITLACRALAEVAAAAGTR